MSNQKTMTFKGKVYPIGEHPGKIELETLSEKERQAIEQELAEELEELIELAAYNLLEEGIEEAKKRIPKNIKKDQDHGKDYKICSGCHCGKDHN